MCLKSEKIDFKTFINEAKKRRETNKIKSNDKKGEEKESRSVFVCNENNVEDCTCDRHFFIFGEPIL